jgi:sugar-specific transcriptional regulator TrmB
VSRERAVEALVELGFSRLESETYTFLAEQSPATGYRVAQALGRPAANVYKAIESLAAKGAVLLDDGDTRLCRAVPQSELLRQLAHSFADRRERAHKALSHLARPAGDERVYQLASREQVLARARTMLAGARQVVLMTAHQTVAAELLPELTAAARRKVDVVLKTYGPVDAPGVELVRSTESDETVAGWPGRELNFTVDGEQHLLAFLNHDGKSVVQAVYSESPYLSLLHHNGLACELALTAMVAALNAGASKAELLRIVDGIRHPLTTPGARRLET